MEVLQLLRTVGALGIVLGMLAGALWVVKRYDIKLPGRVGGHAKRRLEIVEKLAIDNRRSVALIRRDGREHLILLSPEGPLLIEGRDERDAAPAPAMQPSITPAAPILAPAIRTPPEPAPAADLRVALAGLLERARRAPQRPEAVRELRHSLANLMAKAEMPRAEAPTNDFREVLAAFNGAPMPPHFAPAPQAELAHA